MQHDCGGFDQTRTSCLVFVQRWLCSGFPKKITRKETNITYHCTYTLSFYTKIFYKNVGRKKHILIKKKECRRACSNSSIFKLKHGLFIFFAFRLAQKAKINSIAVKLQLQNTIKQDFSIAFFGQAKSVLKGFKDEKCNCVYIDFLINHLAPSNLRKS